MLKEITEGSKKTVAVVRFVETDQTPEAGGVKGQEGKL